MSKEVLIAKMALDRHMKDASPELRRAWQIIRSELDPNKIKRRKL
jgi:hypothetical protein